MELNLPEKTFTQDNFTDFNCDLAIIGGGPAAITAAQYAHKGGISVTTFEPRGLARKVTHHSVCFLPGLDGPISVAEYARIMA